MALDSDIEFDDTTIGTDGFSGGVRRRPPVSMGNASLTAQTRQMEDEREDSRLIRDVKLISSDNRLSPGIYNSPRLRDVSRRKSTPDKSNNAIGAASASASASASATRIHGSPMQRHKTHSVGDIEMDPSSDEDFDPPKAQFRPSGKRDDISIDENISKESMIQSIDRTLDEVFATIGGTSHKDEQTQTDIAKENIELNTIPPEKLQSVAYLVTSEIQDEAAIYIYSEEDAPVGGDKNVAEVKEDVVNEKVVSGISNVIKDIQDNDNDVDEADEDDEDDDDDENDEEADFALQALQKLNNIANRNDPIKQQLKRQSPITSTRPYRLDPHILDISKETEASVRRNASTSSPLRNIVASRETTGKAADSSPIRIRQFTSISKVNIPSLKAAKKPINDWNDDQWQRLEKLIVGGLSDEELLELALSVFKTTSSDLETRVRFMRYYVEHEHIIRGTKRSIEDTNERQSKRRRLHGNQ